MRFFNADGSESGACGNGTRCVARLLFDEGRAAPSAGRGRAAAARPSAWPTAGSPWRWASPSCDWRRIPLAEPCDTLEVPLDVAGLPRPVAVGMGNPHVVFLVADVAAIDVGGWARNWSTTRSFPERANIGFAQLLAPDVLRLRVFERGAGLDAGLRQRRCAAMVAARRRGLVGDRARLDAGRRRARGRMAGRGRR